MNYLIIFLGGILTLLSATVKIYFDPAFVVLPFSISIRRTFALAFFIVIGIVRDGLFTTLPWYSPLLFTLSIIVLRRVYFSWILVGITTSGFYIIDTLLRFFLWKSNFSLERVILTLILVILMSYIQDRYFAHKEGE